MTESTRSKLTVTAAMLLSIAMLGGCVERTIQITSKPPGALVYLNDREVGRTPLTVPFTFYGTYDVRLEKEGYEPLWTKRSTQTPWYDHLGVDLLAELKPGRTEAKQMWHFEMQEAGPANESLLLDRAKQMRSLTRQRTPID